jgi:acyl-CoA thioesterase
VSDLTTGPDPSPLPDIPGAGAPIVDLAVPPRWLGLEGGADGHYAFELTPLLARFDGRLFGGTGIALTVAAFEAETGRDALWTTVQFAGSAEVGECIDCHVEVLAVGRHTSQVRLTAVVGDRMVLAALGATASSSPEGFAARLGDMPLVSGPDDSEPFDLGFPLTVPELAERGPFAMAEYRQARGSEGSQVWARMRDTPQSRATLGYLADFVPNAVVRAAGRAGGGTSLDNSIRFGPGAPAGTEWLLLDFDPFFAANGYVHGAARIWSADGLLLAVASQTAVAKLFD